MTYHVLPIGITILLIYLFSLYLSASGFTARHSHRRFWNWVLLLAFLTAALFGLFLALKITYRWKVSFAETLLHWHVEAGIAMALTALIHLSWHLGYYFKRSKSRGRAEPAPAPPPAAVMAAPHTGPLLVVTGFVSSSSQFILLREAAILGGGTEASTGLFLWLWLITAAGGAITGAGSSITSVRKMMWTLTGATVMAPLCFLLMNTIVLGPGQTPSFFQMLVIMAVTVAPVTFIAALVFVRLSLIRYQSGSTSPGRSFGAETAGSVAAGIVTAMTVTLKIPNYTLYLAIILAGSAVAVWCLEYRAWVRIAALAALIPMFALVALLKPDRTVRSLLLRGVEVEKSIDTPFGNITTGLYGEDRTVYYDHRPLFYPGDVITAEEDIHYALLQREAYDRVLLISGGLKRHLAELCKYRINNLTYVEMDPGLIEAEGARDTICGRMKVKVAREDPMTYLKDDGGSYDAVIQLVPPPSTLSVNRFYTAEYFAIVRDALTPDGIFLCTPMPWFNYSPDSYRKGFSPLYNALSGAFSHVTLIPGSCLYAVASEGPVSYAVADLVQHRGIISSYVNNDYLSDSEIKTKMEQILAQVDGNAPMNTALRPVTSLFSNLLSFERMGLRSGVVALIVIMMIIPFVLVSRGGPVMFASSAGLAGFSMITIFIVQITVGNTYILSAVILALLMAGLAAGASAGPGNATGRVKVNVVLLSGVILLSGLLAPSLAVSSPVTVMVFILVTVPLAGLFTGRIFRILARQGTGETTGRIYAADLAGSALGYLTAATLLVPLTGTRGACYILGAFILVSGIVASVTIKD
jgi:hypothetical protein